MKLQETINEVTMLVKMTIFPIPALNLKCYYDETTTKYYILKNWLHMKWIVMMMVMDTGDGGTIEQ